MAHSSRNTQRSFHKDSGPARLRNSQSFRDWNWFLQSEPLAISNSEFKRAKHEGEVFAGAQGILFYGANSRPTVSVSYIRRVHVSAAPELDTGTFQQSGSILLSDDVHGFHVDMNEIVAEQIQGAARRAQFGQTLSISHPLGHFTISAEIWHFSQPLLHGNAAEICGPSHIPCARTL